MLQSSINLSTERRQSGFFNQHSLTPSIAYFNYKAILLDVRTVQEFYYSKISGARHISYDMLPTLLDEIKKWDVPVITYSTYGSRSKLATALLKRAKIPVVDGGAKVALEQLLFQKK